MTTAGSRSGAPWGTLNWPATSMGVGEPSAGKDTKAREATGVWMTGSSSEAEGSRGGAAEEQALSAATSDRRVNHDVTVGIFMLLAPRGGTYVSARPGRQPPHRGALPPMSTTGRKRRLLQPLGATKMRLGPAPLYAPSPP